MNYKSAKKINIQPNLKLTEKWLAMKAENPGLYPREAARLLAVSECELLPSTVAGDVFGVGCFGIRECLAISGSETKLIVRNDQTVLEFVAAPQVFQMEASLIFSWQTGVVEIDAKASCFLVIPQKGAGRASLQWYDSNGRSLLKCFYENEELLLSLFSAIDSSNSEGAQPEGQAALMDGQNLAVENKNNGALNESMKSQIAQVPLLFEGGQQLTSPDELLDFLTTIKDQPCLFLFKGALSQTGAGYQMVARHTPQKIMPARGWQNILDPNMNLHIKPELCDRYLADGPGDMRWMKFSGQDGGDFFVGHKKQTVHGA